MAKWASFFEHLYICQKYPFSLKARRQASRLPPAAFFLENDPFFSLKARRQASRLAPAAFFLEKTLLGGATAAATTTTTAEEFPVPARPHPITQGYHIPFGFSPPFDLVYICLLYTSPSPRDQRGSRMPSSA